MSHLYKKHTSNIYGNFVKMVEKVCSKSIILRNVC